MGEEVAQVTEARVPRHTIPLKDTRPSIQRKFRYDPAKEEKLEALCDDLLAAVSGSPLGLDPPLTE